MNLVDVKGQMERVIEFFKNELKMIRTGTASSVIVEGILVDAYEGAPKMRLQELATISIPEPRMIVIKPFDGTVLRKIEKALYSAEELKLTPVIDGEMIRITIPQMTQERREEFVKALGKKIEIGKVAVRQERHDKMIEIKKAFENKELNEDEKFKLEKDLQEMTDGIIKIIEEIGAAKEKEILAI